MTLSFEQEQIIRRLKEGGSFVNLNIADGSVEEQDQFRRAVREVLHLTTVLVEFEKADGSTRVMTCTLSDAHGAKYTKTPIVENAAADAAKPKKVNTDVCPVWDIHAGAWRSFRWDRLKRIDFKVG